MKKTRQIRSEPNKTIYCKVSMWPAVSHHRVRLNFPNGEMLVIPSSAVIGVMAEQDRTGIFACVRVKASYAHERRKELQVLPLSLSHEIDAFMEA